MRWAPGRSWTRCAAARHQLTEPERQQRARAPDVSILRCKPMNAIQTDPLNAAWGQAAPARVTGWVLVCRQRHSELTTRS